MNDFPAHLKALCNFPPKRWEFPPGRANNMLVMHDRCDSMADENEADVSKPKHSSCVERSRRASFHPREEEEEKEKCFEKADGITSYNM